MGGEPANTPNSSNQDSINNNKTVMVATRNFRTEIRVYWSSQALYHFLRLTRSDLCSTGSGSQERSKASRATPWDWMIGVIH
jgi:hypothetical protein